MALLPCKCDAAISIIPSHLSYLAVGGAMGSVSPAEAHRLRRTQLTSRAFPAVALPLPAASPGMRNRESTFTSIRDFIRSKSASAAEGVPMYAVQVSARATMQNDKGKNPTG